jgi:hypothetical protein
MAVLMPSYERYKRNGRWWGRLLSDYVYRTPITGYAVTVDASDYSCTLLPDGSLIVRALTVWDYGSGPVVQSGPMIYASLAHDMFCHMTDRGFLPWSVRHEADKYFYHCLSEAGATISRFWRTPAVMLYSQTVARWRRTK